MQSDLTKGQVMRTMIGFAIPMILGDLLQQCYNIADTLIVGQFLGAGALAAVGSAFSLITFLTSIILGLAMGSGTVFSIRVRPEGHGRPEGRDPRLLCPAGGGDGGAEHPCLRRDRLDHPCLADAGELVGMMHDYLIIIFAGLIATFLYNFFAFLLRSLGNSVTPLLFLAVSAVLNIVLDLWFVAGLGFGVAGAAAATVIAQYVSGIGIAVYTFFKAPGWSGRRKGSASAGSG